MENPTQHTTTETPQKKRRSKRVFFNSIASFCNHVAAISLLIAYLAPYVSPENFWLIAFFGLAYPVILILNLFFVAYWAIQFKKRFAYSLIIILGGWVHLSEYVQFNPIALPATSTKTIKMMSYNVKSFDLYNWNNDKDTRSKMLQLIAAENADIICFQEFYTGHDSSRLNDNLDTIKKIQNSAEVHTGYVASNAKRSWGNATFSKHPIVATGQIKFEKSTNLCIYTDIKLNEDTIRVYNLHLESIHFGYVDYKFIEDVMQNNETEELENSKNILRRLKRAFIKRSVQSEQVAEHIAQSPYPVFVCGDFNDPPVSYAYHTISENLYDAFMESGKGFGRTYVGKFPSFRIDHILHNKNYKAYDFKTIHQQLSDHYPLCCYLEKN